MQPRVRVEQVGMTYNVPSGETVALTDVSLNIYPEEFVSIVGPSGCGKSTLLSLICGLLSPTAGRIYVDDAPVTSPSRRIGYMLQNDYLFGWRTVLDNCLLGLEIQRDRSSHRVEQVKQLLEAMGLGEFQRHYPHQLSGGMRQRAALVRTLACKPDILLLDEPFGALDYQTRLRLSGEAALFLREQRKTVVLVTHDIAEAVSMSDRVVVLSQRPATIRQIVNINLSAASREPMAVRNAPEFNPLFQKIWSLLEPAPQAVAGRETT